MKYDVLKIGGSILSTPKSYIDVSMYIKKFVEKNKRLIIVVSALKGMTDLLIDFYDNNNKNALDKFIEKYQDVVFYFDNQELKYKFNSLINELLNIAKNGRNHDLKIRDKILSYGEKISKLILFYALKINDLNATPLNADDIIITDNRYGDAFIDLDKTSNNLHLNEDIYLIEGFIGRSYENYITTLGRGGSDYTASVLSYLINADNLYLITDVPGIYSSDPRIVKNVKIVKRLNFEEAIEASTYNVKGINYKTFYPLINSKINVYIGTFDNFNTIINSKPLYNEHVKLFGLKHANEIKSIGLIGYGMNKDFIIKRIYNLFDGNHNDIMINKNGEKPSMHINVKTDDFHNFVNLLHDELIGDNL
ncbi:aspartokinase [Caldisphaera lagunensis DSM 15908]|uniref:Aspartokinase n=1 Tax=Caldisphaera lagunensis (strain DSM 15908 / JCM 11604 / ANMR 0165 / IC-154) TaxID=1056495 RepID=L0AA28_CALLD|nr:aspartate kinase [Caldisphaera lagunensis]AFZ69905.1 aspartokinase [Caldisphaera lagunensis DSM 15908]